MVHSDLDHHGFTHALIDFARENGVAAYTGDGSNRWPAANTYDIGVLYRLALEKAPAGSTLHGVGDTGIPRKVIAETIAGKLGIEARSITDEERRNTLVSSPPSRASTTPTSNDKTRKLLGWEPTHPGLGRGRGDGPLLRLTARRVRFGAAGGPRPAAADSALQLERSRSAVHCSRGTPLTPTGCRHTWSAPRLEVGVNHPGDLLGASHAG